MFKPKKVLKIVRENFTAEMNDKFKKKEIGSPEEIKQIRIEELKAELKELEK